MLGLAQRPAAGALLPRATRSIGGEGLAQEISPRKKERKKEEKGLSRWRNAAGAVPDRSLLSLLAAVARLGESNFELPPRGFPLPVSVGKKARGEELPGAADVDFSRPLRREIGTPRRQMRTMAPHTGVAWEARFWG